MSRLTNLPHHLVILQHTPADVHTVIIPVCPRHLLVDIRIDSRHVHRSQAGECRLSAVRYGWFVGMWCYTVVGWICARCRWVGFRVCLLPEREGGQMRSSQAGGAQGECDYNRRPRTCAWGMLASSGWLGRSRSTDVHSIHTSPPEPPPSTNMNKSKNGHASTPKTSTPSSDSPHRIPSLFLPMAVPQH